MDLITYQKTIYQKVKSLNYSVYDYVPLDSQLPYIRLDYNQTLDDSTKTSEGYEVLQYINIFSNYRGQKEVREIAQSVIDNVKAIEGLDVRLRNLIVRQETDKEQAMTGVPQGSIYQATIVLKIKI